MTDLVSRTGKGPENPFPLRIRSNDLKRDYKSYLILTGRFGPPEDRVRDLGRSQGLGR